MNNLSPEKASDQPQAERADTRFMRMLGHPVLVSLLLAATTLAAYWRVRECGFTNYDDPEFVTSNAHVRGGITRENVVWAFSNQLAGNWHPLTVLSHMLDCQLSGLRPGGHHLTNLLLHVANTVLLFVVLRRMTGALWRSAFVAALFALHPLHVESVAWVAERKDVLSAFFGLLTLLFYARYAQGRAMGDGQLATGKSHGSRPSALDHRLCFGALVFRAGSDEQADAGDAAVCDVVAGLLAAAAGFKFSGQIINDHPSTIDHLATDPGEDAFLPAQRGYVRCYGLDAANGQYCGLAFSFLIHFTG